MEIKDKNYILLIGLHVFIGLIIFLIPSLAKLYTICIIVFGLYYVLKTMNRENNILLVAGYIVGSEVLLRMTNGNFFYEFSKYGVILFMFIGFYYSGFSKNAIPMWLFLLLIIPGILVATETLNLTTDIRKTILFNVSGPICLGISGIYCYNRKISFNQLSNVLLAIGLPIISTTVYLILYTPDLKEILIGTGSNSHTSGGFGPNQVSTILGLGMFIFTSRLLLQSNSKLIFVINLILAFNISFRGLLTFSRGGMITGLFMIIVLLVFIYRLTKSSGKMKLNFLIFSIFLIFSFTWIYTTNETGGLINKRYANEDAVGKSKSSQLTGREDIFESEFNAFLEHPIFGVGPGKGMEIREVETGGLKIASHNEITRMLAEHGLCGILGLFILFLTPIFLYFDNKQHIFIFCFLGFWLLTINHAAMRIAAPAFVYSLSLLKLYFYEKDTIHR
jgi:O-antigen ligase